MIAKCSTIYAGKIPCCADVIEIPIGIGDTAMVVNVSGRSGRVFRYAVSSANGIVSFEASKLPKGYLSEKRYLYNLWFESLDGEKITFEREGKMYELIQFEVEKVVFEEDETEKVVRLWNI